MMNNKGEFTLNVYSSLEGHALILISGNNLMVKFKEAKTLNLNLTNLFFKFFTFYLIKLLI